jgi:hypothetical protein
MQQEKQNIIQQQKQIKIKKIIEQKISLRRKKWQQQQK